MDLALNGATHELRCVNSVKQFLEAKADYVPRTA
jgi:hypothetical protein